MDKILITLNYIESYINNETTVVKRLCHNDAFHSNFIHSDRLYLIDWEYAGMGDIFFDLASIANFSIVDGDLANMKNEKLILYNYFNNIKEEDLVKIRRMRVIVCLWNASWALVQHQFSDIDHNYLQMSELIFKRAQALIKLCDFSQD